MHTRLAALAIGWACLLGGVRPDGVAAAPRVPSRAACPLGAGVLPIPTGPSLVGAIDVPTPPDVGHVTAFYPTHDCTHRVPAYLRADIIAALGLDPSFLDQVIVHAQLGARPVKGRARPVVVITPGWTSFVALSTALATELASHGFIVVTADPILGSETNPLPNDDDAARRRTSLGAVLDLLDDRSIERLIGHIDHTRIAAGGHSYAGSISFQVAQTDERLRSVFDLDGILHGLAVERPMRVPSLIFSTARVSFGHPTLETALAQSPRAVGVVLDDADHYDVTDAPDLAKALPGLVSQLSLGPIGPDAVESTNTVVLSFLRCTLARHPCTPTSETLTAQVAHTRPWPPPPSR